MGEVCIQLQYAEFEVTHTNKAAQSQLTICLGCRLQVRTESTDL